tara:strand:+ start:319 stop:528 length:210 start_codon:yes stop_codon:yes gene_type:complete
MNEPEFIKVNSGDIVIAEYNEIARDLSFVVGARDPNTLYFFNSQTLILEKFNIFEVKKFNKFCPKVNRF